MQSAAFGQPPRPLRKARPGSRYIVLAALCLPALAATASQEATRDASTFPEGSAVRAAAEAHAVLADKLRRLTRAHEQLVDLVAGDPDADSRLIDALKTQQQQWLRYTAAECDLTAALRTGAADYWKSEAGYRCQANLTDNRYRTVGYARRCLLRSRESGLAGGIGLERCLTQLNPLGLR